MLGLCLAATLFLWLTARRSLEARAAERLERAAHALSNGMATRIRDYEDVARSAAGFLAGSQDVAPDEFHRYVEQLDFPRRDPAFVSLAFIEPVPRDALPAWVEARRRAGALVEVQQASGSGDSYLIRLFEAARPGGAVVGLNAGANPVNRATLDASRDTASARVAAPLPLARFPSDHGLALQFPVFTPGPPGTREFRGWMSIMVRLKPLMEEAHQSGDPDVAVSVSDGGAAGADRPLFETPGATARWPPARRETLTLPGHRFDLLFTPRPGFGAAVGAVRPAATLSVGILVSLLLFSIASSLVSTQRRATALAGERTRSLRESQRRYEVLFEQNVAGIFRSTLDGRILECNDAFARIFGYASRREALEDSAASLYENPAERERFITEIRDKGTILNRAQRYHRRDGRPVWTLEYVTLRPEEPDVIEGTIVDVSEARRAEEALRASEERYRGVFQNFRDGIFFLDTVTKAVFDSNLSLQRTLGYTAGEMNGLSIYDLVADDRAVIDENVARAASATFTHLGERRYRRKDGGSVGMDVESFRFEEAGRPVIFVVARNLAERRLLEDQLRQAQKMEAVGRLAGGVAHDFNNLLTAILGYSDLVLTGDAPEDVRQNVEEVRKAAERAASLTRQLLAFSRKQVLQPLVLELNDVVKNLDGMLHRVLRENVKIVFEPDPHLWRVKADPGQIEQILMNLAVNASDAMPEGGRLTVRTRNVTLGPGDLGEIPMRPGPYVLLEVSDTGHGMDAETLGHAFEPFFTTKERGKGTGLGLATVYGIVKQSGGYIQVLSEPAKGAMFRIFLPRAHGAADSPSNVSPRPAPIRGSETILLVEDEESVRKLAHTVLRARGYQVLVADSAEAALELSRGHPGPVHLLLTDVVLPGMDGHRLAAILRAERPDTAVLLSSGYFDAGEGTEGTEPLLRKPFTPDGLVDKVRSTLRKARGAFP